MSGAHIVMSKLSRLIDNNQYSNEYYDDCYHEYEITHNCGGYVSLDEYENLLTWFSLANDVHAKEGLWNALVLHYKTAGEWNKRGQERSSRTGQDETRRDRRGQDGAWDETRRKELRWDNFPRFSGCVGGWKTAHFAGWRCVGVVCTFFRLTLTAVTWLTFGRMLESTINNCA